MDENPFTIRAITEADKDYLQMGLSQMTKESRRLRFFSSIKALTNKELDYFTKVDQHNHLAYVAIFNGISPAGSIRCVRNNKRSEFAELAVTIVDKFHHQGLGFRMLETLASAAIKEKITHLYGDFHASNVNMLKLLQKYCQLHNIPTDSFQLKHKDDGFLYFEMALA